MPTSRVAFNGCAPNWRKNTFHFEVELMSVGADLPAVYLRFND